MIEDDSLPSRDELVMYASQVTGLPDYDVMSLTMNAVFGNARVPFDEIEIQRDFLEQTYQDFELQQVEAKMSNFSFEEEKQIEKKIPKKEQTEEKKEHSKGQTSEILEKINELKNNNKLMIDYQGKEVVKMPPANQRCPCGSKKVYKKCECFEKDRQRTAEFIEGAPKKEEKK